MEKLNKTDLPFSLPVLADVVCSFVRQLPKVLSLLYIEGPTQCSRNRKSHRKTKSLHSNVGCSESMDHITSKSK